jgi:hypothetical protein
VRHSLGKVISHESFSNTCPDDIEKLVQKQDGSFLQLPLPSYAAFNLRHGLRRVAEHTYNLMVQNLDVDEGGRPSDPSSVFINILNQTSFNVKVMDPSLYARNYLLRYRGFEERLLVSGLSARIGVLLSTLEMVRDQFGEFLNESQRTSIESALSQLRTVNASLPGGTVELQLLTPPGDQSAQAISGIIDSIAGRLGERVLGAKPILSLESEIVQARRLRPVD